MAARRGGGLRHGAGSRAFGRCGRLSARRRGPGARPGAGHRLPDRGARPGRRPLARVDAGGQENRRRRDTFRADAAHRPGADPPRAAGCRARGAGAHRAVTAMGVMPQMEDLACYASNPMATRGRRHPEPPPQNRTEFQRDRDRIIHCTAFRRLEYKTQVFVNHEGDLFRTRLTHSLEVAQIARTLARSLRLSEDLTEAISLAHDLGHTPFGHAGQDELNACMRELAPHAGGFEHNLQSLRVVDELEERYAEFSGLNLCFETREGILKHCSVAHARQLGEVGERFLNRTRPSLEAQVANLADEIAYNNHDIDDGLRSGLITLEQMQEVTIFGRHYAQVAERYPRLAPRRAVAETVRRMINTLIVDLTATSLARIAEAAPADADAVRRAPPLAGFSDSV